MGIGQQRPDPLGVGDGGVSYLKEPHSLIDTHLNSDWLNVKVDCI